MQTRQKKVKFSKGQISPELVERTDLDLLNSSAQKMENVVSTIYGGVRTRRGTKYIDIYTGATITPSGVTSDLGGNTSDIITLTPYTSAVLSNNKLIAKIEYAETLTGNNVISIKNIKGIKNPITITPTVNLLAGHYELILVGGGSGGASGKNPLGSATYACSGSSGAYFHGVVNIDDGSYNISIGAGGNGATSESTAVSSGSGGDSSALGVIAGGGKSSTVQTPGAAGTVNTSSADIVTIYESVNGIKGSGGQYSGSYKIFSGGASVYNGYGRGGDAGRSGVAIAYNGSSGYAEINAIPMILPIKVEVSDDDVTYDTIGVFNISEVGQDLIFNTDFSFRYIKVSIDDEASYQFKLYLDYISVTNENLTVTSERKLKDFIFNNEQKYLLALSEGLIDIYKDDSKVASVTATGLQKEYLSTIKTTSKDDTIIFTHPLMHPKQLQRQSDGSFVWGDFAYNNIPYYAFEGETRTTKTVSITPSAEEGAIKITAASSIFDATWVGQKIDGNGGIARITEYVSDTVVNAVTQIPFYTNDAIASWDKISGYEPVWSATRGYPRTCLFAQERLFFGGSKSLPSTIWASRINDINNFKNSGNYDNDSINIELLTNEVIVNLLENRGVHIFTSGQEWSIPEDSITPNAIRAAKNTQNGSLDTVVPGVIGGVAIFIEKNGKSLLSYIYDYNQAAYTTDNISLFSSLIQAPVDLSVETNSNRDKGDFIFLVLSDGKMLTGCISIQQDIRSISQFITEGVIKSVCSLGGDTYILVERNGADFLEKIEDVMTDSTLIRFVNSDVIDNLYQFEGKEVIVYDDSLTIYGRGIVSNGALGLFKNPNKNIMVGLAFYYDLESNPIAINQETATCKKRISKATIACKDTQEITFNGQTKKRSNNYEFFACSKYDNDIRFNIIGSFYPIDVLSITLDINYEG